MTVQVHIITLTALTLLSIPTLASIVLLVALNINDFIKRKEDK